MKKWKLKRTKQCAKCPWRKDCNPHEIPGGYSEDKHHDLKKTISRSTPDDVDLGDLFRREMHMMACHEQHDAHCIGWLVQQSGVGHNLGLRLQLTACENAGEIETFGEQHETFEETLPR